MAGKATAGFLKDQAPSDPLGLGEASVPLSDLATLDEAQKVLEDKNVQKQTAQLNAMGPVNYAAVDASKSREKAIAQQGDAIPQAAADQMALNPTNVQVVPAPDQAPVPTGPAPTMAPVALPAVEKAAPVAMEPQKVPAVDQKGSETQTVATPAAEKDAQTDAKAVEIVQQAKAEPKIGQQLLELAKNAGVGLLELIQGFAKGYSGSDLPLASQIREQEKLLKSQQDATAEQAEKERAFQAVRDKAEQDFQMRISQIQMDYENRRFAATTQAEREAADRQRAFEQQEAQKDRDTTLKVAEMETTEKKAAKAQDKKADVAKIMQNIFAQGQ